MKKNNLKLFSPFLTSEKPGAEHRRVIVDLSFPHGSSVNTGVDPESYLGTPQQANYVGMTFKQCCALMLFQRCKFMQMC